MNNLSVYITNKCVSFLGVFLCIGLTLYWFGNTVTQWQAILVAIIIFGYGHFILGFYYQLKGFLRKTHSWQYFLTFFVLTIFSIALAYTLLLYTGFATALFIGFLYFLFHGLLNEQTLIQRQTGHLVPLIFLSALAIFVIALLTYSVPDKTFFFDRNLQFQTFDSFYTAEFVFERFYLSLEYFSMVFWIGFGLSIGTLLYAYLRHGFGVLTSFLLGVILLATAGVGVYGPPPYIYMYVFVVGYHFMTWLLFYLVEMKRRGNAQYRNFVMQNIGILAPFLLAAYVFFSGAPYDWAVGVFDYFVFVIATYIHISTSFMNDDWFQRVQHWTFEKLGFETARSSILS